MTGIVTVCGAIASVLASAAALVRAFRTQSNLTAHLNDPEAHQ